MSTTTAILKSSRNIQTYPKDLIITNQTAARFAAQDIVAENSTDIKNSNEIVSTENILDFSFIQTSTFPPKLQIFTKNISYFTTQKPGVSTELFVNETDSMELENVTLIKPELHTMIPVNLTFSNLSSEFGPTSLVSLDSLPTELAQPASTIFADSEIVGDWNSSLEEIPQPPQANSLDLQDGNTSGLEFPIVAASTPGLLVATQLVAIATESQPQPVAVAVAIKNFLSVAVAIAIAEKLQNNRNRNSKLRSQFEVAITTLYCDRNRIYKKF